MCSGRQGDLLDWMMGENSSGESQVGRAGRIYDKIWNRGLLGGFFKMGLLKMV